MLSKDYFTVPQFFPIQTQTLQDLIVFSFNFHLLSFKRIQPQLGLWVWVFQIWQKIQLSFLQCFLSFFNLFIPILKYKENIKRKIKNYLFFTDHLNKLFLNNKNFFISKLQIVMLNQEDFIRNLEMEMQTLFQSPPSYMRQISKMSQKVVSLQIKHMFYAVNKASKILEDPFQPIKKKFLAFRFVKDTILLSSHSFFVFTLIKFLPLISEILSDGQHKTDNGLQILMKKIGTRSQISNSIQVKAVSTSMLQLFRELVKWMGTNIKNQPFYTVPFSTLYKNLLDAFSKVKAIKITQLTYYTTDDIKVYEHNYLQNQLNSEQWIKQQRQFIDLLVSNWISLPEDDLYKQLSLKQLQNIIQTGDSLYIQHIINCLKPIIQSPITGYQGIQIIHQLMKIKEIEFYIHVRNDILQIIGHYILMMSVQKFSQIQHIDLLEIVKLLFVWKIQSLKLGLKTEIYDELFKKLKQQWIFINDSQYTSKVDKIQEKFEKHSYFLDQKHVLNTNNQKKQSLNLKEQPSLIKKIKNLQYHKKQQDKNNDFQLFKQRNQSKGNLLKQKNEKYRNNQPSDKSYQKNERFLPQMIERNSFQKLQTQSPIKQLNIKYEDQSKQLLKNIRPVLQNSNQQFIKFSNSLNNIESSREQKLNGKYKEKYKDKINNIYTARNINQNKKSQLSSRSNKSSKKSSQKFEKVSSLGLGIQKVKSAKYLDFKIQQNQQKSSFNDIKLASNSPKVNLLKFDDSQLNEKKSPNRLFAAGQSDNKPYKQEVSQSNSNHSEVNKYSISNLNSHTLSKSRKIIKNQQIIIVQSTVRKPKFGFSKVVEEDSLTDFQITPKQKLHQSKQTQKTEFFPVIASSLQSIQMNHLMLSQDKISKYSSVPSKFNIAFGKKQGKFTDQNSNSQISGVKLNKFPNKLKQLENQIQKTKEYQLLYQQKMKKKDEQYENALKNLPPTHDHIYDLNNKLRIQLQEKQRKQVQKLIKKQQKAIKSSKNKNQVQEIQFLPEKIFDLGKVEPFQRQIMKQLVSNKCLLQKNQFFELGYAFKKQEHNISKQNIYLICLYFKFKVRFDQFSFKITNESILFDETFEAVVTNIAQNKQLKFEHQIMGYKLLKQRFISPLIIIQAKPQKQLRKQKNQQRQNKDKIQYKITIPCSLMSFIEFHTPHKKIQQIKTTYAIKACLANNQFLSSLKGQYLINNLKCGKWEQNLQLQKGLYVSYFAYIKNVKQRRKPNQSQSIVYLNELKGLQKKQINLLIKKINQIMFYIQSDNKFQEDKIVLKQLARMISR